MIMKKVYIKDIIHILDMMNLKILYLIKILLGIIRKESKS